MFLEDVAAAIARADSSPARVDDFEEWKSVIESNRYLDSPRLYPLEPESGFEARLDKIELGQLKILRFETNVRHVAETRGTLERSVLVTLPLVQGAASISLGSQSYDMSKDAGVIFSDNELPTRFETSEGMNWVSVVVPRTRLERTCMALSGRPLHSPIHFLPRLEGRTSPWIHYLSGIVRDSAAAAKHDILRENLEQLAVTSLLLGQPHNYSEIVANATETVLPKTVRRAIELMEGHIEEPLTISMLAARLGVGMRALQLGFRRHLGCSPGEWLRDCRLERAHQMLMSGGVSVTHAAMALGFANVGEFAAHYHKRFGRHPSETARRA